ncbi:MAG: YdiU family protein, partial [Neisseriaceae bacterium]|nr:YdiU family protein [Neisseriaceae bacterium]
MLSKLTLPLHFERQFCLALPEDAVRDFHTPRPVDDALWSAAMPTPVVAPTLLAYNANLAQTLGLNSADMNSTDCLAMLSGNDLMPTMQPWATCYGGHQFGHWAGQLGDGRAISLGEQVLNDGQRLEWQLKGAGLTPYSRRGDGRAVLRSSLREYVASVAMIALGVPTTNALSLVSTGEVVLRDKFYDGRAAYEMGAIVCRVAPTFLRFGHFEWLSKQGNFRELMALTDYTIAHHFPDLLALENESKRLAAWFAKVAELTANLLVDWLRVGFVHGVMNTDNLSIIGLTIDFGPFAWLDQFEFGYTSNTSDHERRYAYAKQAKVARWNLAFLGQALIESEQNPTGLPLTAIQAGLAMFDDTFNHGYQSMMNTKLGLSDLLEEDVA